MSTQNSRAQNQIRQAYGLGSQDATVDRGVLAPHGIVVPSDQMGTVRCEARPWSDWCTRGTPLWENPQKPGERVCGACRREGYKAPASGQNKNSSMKPEEGK